MITKFRDFIFAYLCKNATVCVPIADHDVVLESFDPTLIYLMLRIMLEICKTRNEIAIDLITILMSIIIKDR